MFMILVIITSIVSIFYGIIYAIARAEGFEDGKRSYYEYDPYPNNKRFSIWAYSRGFVAGKKWREKNANKPSWRKHYEDKAKAKIAAFDKPKNAEPDEEF